jgi:hypothetical protein
MCQTANRLIDSLIHEEDRFIKMGLLHLHLPGFAPANPTLGIDRKAIERHLSVDWADGDFIRSCSVGRAYGGTRARRKSMKERLGTI